MEIKCCFIMIWMINFITAQKTDESISFSPIYKVPSNSYWHGYLEIGKNTSFLEEGIRLQISLNEIQGLLFYAIDNRYRTIWVEFTKDVLEISHYNFKINSPDKRSLKISDLRSYKDGNQFNMTFFLIKDEIRIMSNGKSKPIDYSKFPNSISTKDLDKFRESFDLPIPIFNNTDRSSEVHIWIGNTPTTKNEKIQNAAELKNNKNLLGCVMFFAIKDIKLKLATTGDRIGEMITSYCNPVCNSNTCSNNGDCHDLWRGRYRCECEPSQYIGKHCEIEHSVKFDGNLAIEEKLEKYIKLQKLKFTFKANILDDYGGFKLLSLRFLKDQYFQVYIDAFYYLHGRFITETQTILDHNFKNQVKHKEIYSFFAEINVNGIEMKIYNSTNRTCIETQQIPKNQLNLVIQSIIVGGSHNHIIKWLKNFRGCFSNLILTSGSKEFVWNQMAGYNQSPKCGKSSNSTNQLKTMYKSELLLKEKKNTGKNKILNERDFDNVDYKYTAYILIAVVFSICLLIVLIFVIIIKFHSRKSNQKTSFQLPEKFLLEDTYYNTKNSFTTCNQNGIAQNEDLVDSASCHVYPASIYMTYKPAYKAKSMCSSITNRSLISLPVSPTPTLATPEDGERL